MVSVRVSSAQMMRAFLFAGATAATLNPRASLSRLAQMLRRSLSSRVRKQLADAEPPVCTPHFNCASQMFMTRDFGRPNNAYGMRR